MARHASAHPHEPFLFFPAGPDWRWWSWRECLREAEAAGATEDDRPRPAYSWRELLASAAGSWPRAGALAATLGAAARRDVLVAHGPVGGRTAALLAGLALRTGAVLLVEPAPDRWPLALVWARPTVVAGDAADLARLGDALRRLEPRKPKRLRRRWGPLGRTRAIVRTDPETGAEPSESWAGFWAQSGLPLMAAPDPRPDPPADRGVVGPQLGEAGARRATAE